MNTKIAFLCLAHNNFEYLAQLSHYYCSDGDGFFLHIDNKVDTVSIESFHPDTQLLSEKERYRTRWGTMDIALASLKLLEKALLNKTYDRFILVSGADTPLVSKEALKEKITVDLSYFSVWQEVTRKGNSKLHDEFFKRHFYNFFLTNPGEAYLTKNKFRIQLMLILYKIITLIPLKGHFNYRTYNKGSQWWCLTRELAIYISDELQNNKNLNQFSKMHAPDEKMFHTVAFNSPLANKISIDKGQEQLKQGLHYIDWGFQKSKPRLQSFTPEDIGKAKKLGCYFARKVDNDNIEYFINYIKQLKNV
jgi:hypothetical protein